MPIKCYIFDFDGTLGDTRDLAWSILNRLADKYGFRKLQPEDMDKARHMTKAQFVRFLGVSKLKIPRLLREGKRMMAEELKTVKLFDGMHDVIREVREQVPTLGIVTSNSAENVQRVLELQKLECFDFISTVPKLSRKHKNLRAVMKTFTYEPEEMLYVGDETRDIAACKKADVPVIGVTWGFNSEQSLRDFGADFIARKPDDLLSIYNRCKAS